METRTEPCNLKISTDCTMCLCCNNILLKEIKIGKYLIGGECYNCNYGTRPFATSKSPCSCEYGEKEFLYYICKLCNDKKCIICDKSSYSHYCSGDCKIYKCYDCKEKEKIKHLKEEFNNKWKSSTPQEKLQLYGITKLKILANKKDLKGFSKYKKEELINILSPLVIESDFPVK